MKNDSFSILWALGWLALASGLLLTGVLWHLYVWPPLVLAFYLPFFVERQRAKGSWTDILLVLTIVSAISVAVEWKLPKLGASLLVGGHAVLAVLAIILMLRWRKTHA